MRAAKCHLIGTRESQSPAMNRLETFAQHFADAVWGTPLVILLLGGGLFFFDPLARNALSAVRAWHRGVTGALRHP